MEEEIKRWTVRRKSALVLEIILGKTTVAEASRQFDPPPSETEDWVAQRKAGMENALRAKPEDVHEQYEKPLKDLQEAYGEAMLELRARKAEIPAGQGRELTEQDSSYGYRAVASLLGMNKNTVQGILQLKGWQLRKRPQGFRPRVQALPSYAAQPNQRWATDM